MGKTIGVISLKGGVGKTSSVVSLGSALSEFGKKVLLVDADFSAPNLGLHLNIINPSKTIHHVLNRVANISDAVHNVGKFDVIPASLFYKSAISPLKLKDSLRYLKKKYDYVLIDSSPSLNEETLATMLASDELFVVTTPDYSTLGTTLKAIKLAKQRGVPIGGLILNKVHGKNFELSLDDIERTADVPVLAVVPHDLNVLKAQSNFVSSVVANPRAKGSIEFKKLAASMIGMEYNPFNLGDFFRISPKKEEVNRDVYYSRVFAK